MEENSQHPVIRFTGLGPGGRRFESCLPDHKFLGFQGIYGNSVSAPQPHYPEQTGDERQ